MIILGKLFKAVSSPVSDDLFKSLAALQKKTNWECDSCMTQNDAGKDICLCCETPKPGSILKSSIPVTMKSSYSFGFPQTNQDELFKSLAAKQKSAQWECDSCLTRNDTNKDKCSCCDTQKPGTKPSVAVAKTSSFSFGMPASNQNSETPKFSFAGPSENVTKSATLDVGFKSLIDKQNANWECTACFTRNDQLKLKCVCCEQQKPGIAIETASQFSFGNKPSGIILPVASEVKFSFGMPAVDENKNASNNPNKASFGAVSNNIVPTLNVAVENPITVPFRNSLTTSPIPTFSFKVLSTNNDSASVDEKDITKVNECKDMAEKSIEKALPAFTFGKLNAESNAVLQDKRVTFESASALSTDSKKIVIAALGQESFKKSDSSGFSFVPKTSSSTNSLNKNGDFSFGSFIATSETPSKSSVSTTTPQAMPSNTSGFSFDSNSSPLATKLVTSPIVFGNNSLTLQPSKSNVIVSSTTTKMSTASTFTFGGASKDTPDLSKTQETAEEVKLPSFSSTKTNVFEQESNDKIFSFTNSKNSEPITVSVSSSGAFTFSGKNKRTEPAAGNSMLFGSGNAQNTLQSVTPVFGANTASATFGTFGATIASPINNNNESGFGSKMPSFGSCFGTTNNIAPQANNRKSAFQFGMSEDPAAKKKMPSFEFSSQPAHQSQQQTTVFFNAVNHFVLILINFYLQVPFQFGVSSGENKQAFNFTAAAPSFNFSNNGATNNNSNVQV